MILCCPQCGSKDGWRFRLGNYHNWAKRFTPDKGHCEDCGFRYTQGVSPLDEQVAKFREKQEPDDGLRASALGEAAFMKKQAEERKKTEGDEI